MYINDRKKIDKEKIENIKKRSQIENYIRYLLLSDNYIEVKTPIINRYVDIAPIKQFKVQSPLEDSELYLRIAPTEQLKKLICLGFDKIFEFSTNFRNDTIDSSHLFEFTSLEIMDKDKNVYDKMNQTEYLIKKCIEYCNDNNISNNNTFLSMEQKKWPKLSVIDYFLEKYSIDLNDEFCIEKLNKTYNSIFLGKNTPNSKNEIISQIIDLIVKEYETPVFIGEFPWYMEGPAKKLINSKGKERYELYYKNIEIANMSSTLVDKKMLIKWYKETLLNKNILENKNYSLDPELINYFIEGMPNSSVVGIGIDNKTNKKIKVIRKEEKKYGKN